MPKKTGDDETDNVINSGRAYGRLDIHALAEAILALPTVAPSGGPGGGAAGGQAGAVFAAGTRSVSISAGQTVEGITFGNFRLASVTGRIRVDADRDGDFDDQPGGYTVLLDGNGNGIADAGGVGRGCLV